MVRAKTRMNEQGRVLIPAEIRAAAGVEPGADVLIEVVGPGQIVIKDYNRFAEAALETARKIYEKHIPTDKDLAGELVRERHRDGERE